MTGPASLLMLQGPLGPLYGQIAGHLMDAGGRVQRIQFSGNDVADWPHAGALDFAGPLTDWPGFLEDRITPMGLDAVLLHGDRRPYHKAAIAWARAHNIPVWVSELGYLRPDWMILEREGTAALSRFPQDPDAIRAMAARHAPLDFTPHWQDRTWPLIRDEIRFTAFNALGRWRFPHYQSHRSQPPSQVYAGWLMGRLGQRFRRRADLPDADLPGADLASADLPGAPRFVFALQLEGDFQLRDHAPFADQAAAVAHVVASFAAHAPEDALLILKPHPHEFARTRLMACIEDLRARHALGPRLRVVEGQPIGTLCQSALGFVTINSSAGMEALTAGCPVHTVMPTIYDVPGLTHQGGLDAFWAEALSLIHI